MQEKLRTKRQKIWNDRSPYFFLKLAGILTMKSAGEFPLSFLQKTRHLYRAPDGFFHNIMLNNFQNKRGSIAGRNEKRFCP